MCGTLEPGSVRRCQGPLQVELPRPFATRRRCPMLRRHHCASTASGLTLRPVLRRRTLTRARVSRHAARGAWNEPGRPILKPKGRRHVSLARLLGLAGAALGPALQARRTRSWCRACTRGSGWRPSTGTASGSGGTAPATRRASTTAPSRRGTTATCVSSRPMRPRGRVFAHIRATTGTPVQQTNCHPFRHGHWLWMHNGAIAGFPSVKRDLTLAVDPALFPASRDRPTPSSSSSSR